MNTMKKISAVVLAVVMVFAMSAMAFAAPTSDGKITIENPVVGHTYTIYQIFELQSFDSDAGTYYYTVAPEWKDFVATQTDFVEVVTSSDNDTDGAVIVKANADAAKFAAAAIEYAKANEATILVADSKTAESDSDVVFSDLELGYYLVDSSLGTICSLNTTDKEVTIREKNKEPKLDKDVQEDKTQLWGKENTAAIGETVNFKITVTAFPGAANYVIHDNLSDGLTLVEDSFKIEGLTVDTDYTVKTADFADDCDFEIAFTEAYLDTLTVEDGTEIVLEYSAILNENAKIAPETNPNTAFLSYGQDVENETTPVSTQTKTMEIELVKTDANKTLLDGATFEIYKEATGGTAVSLYHIPETNVYRIATEAEIAAGTNIVTEFDAGRVIIRGLDQDDVLYFAETKAPEGYNGIDTRIVYTVTDASNLAEVNDTVYVSGGIQVVNNTGTRLPETGGIGTTIFYAVGALLVAGAVIVLISKKRMGKNYSF